MNELKDRLRSARKAANKTQAEVANAVGMAQPSYHQLESGKSVASTFLPLIADYLGVNSLWLQTGTNSKEITHSHLTPAELLAQQLKQFASEGKLSNDDIGFINNTLQHLVKLKESKDAVANGTAPEKKSA